MVRTFSRRTWLKVLAGASVGPFGRAAAPHSELNYRADAQILLFGMPILHRQGVGGGKAVWRELDSEGRFLEFTGYSAPERAAGLNRMGFLRETAQGGECSYFGLMTASPEESAGEGRKSLHASQKEQTYTAIDGRISRTAIETAVVHFTAPAAVSAERSQELVQRARQILASAQKVASPGLAGPPAPSFLQALAALLQRPDGNEGRYIYSGHLYRMRLSRSLDEAATSHFHERVVRVAGRVRRESGGKETDFRLWIPESAERPLPLRIEYQPRPYLRLTFERASGRSA